MYKSKRDRLEILRAQLELERSSFISHWRELGEYFLPRRTRFFLNDVNKGDRRNSKIIDSTPTKAARTLRSGMMGGMTNPARPWFRLTTPDPGLAEFGRVKAWLHQVTQGMGHILLKSNVYDQLPIVYGDLGVFATAAMSVEEDLYDTLRCHSFPLGSYCIAKDRRGKINTWHRDFRMTVRQLVETFGQYDAKTGKPNWEVFSNHVRALWDQSNYEQWIDVCHVIQPNPEWRPNLLDSKFKRFESCYYERGTTGTGGMMSATDEGKFLRESGYDYFPILVPRWEVAGEDVYGTDCPGMTALGDNKQLQLGEKRAAEAIEKMVRPPMTGPTSLRNARVSILPGDMTYSDEREGQKGFRPVHEVNPRIAELEAKQAQIRERINEDFYVHLFQMLSQSDRRDITAEEVREWKEEKLIALGPVYQQVNQDLLDPLIDIAFRLMDEAGQIPLPPEEIQGTELKVEFISIMAQAQKLVGTAGVERFVSFVGNLATAKNDPTVWDKIDTDQITDIYGDMTSVPPGIVRTDDATTALRDARAKAQQAQAQAAIIKEGASAARDLSSADMSGDNALIRLLKGAQAGQQAQ